MDAIRLQKPELPKPKSESTHQANIYTTSTHALTDAIRLTLAEGPHHFHFILSNEDAREVAKCLVSSADKVRGRHTA